METETETALTEAEYRIETATLARDAVEKAQKEHSDGKAVLNDVGSAAFELVLDGSDYREIANSIIQYSERDISEDDTYDYREMLRIHGSGNTRAGTADDASFEDMICHMGPESLQGAYAAALFYKDVMEVVYAIMGERPDYA